MRRHLGTSAVLLEDVMPELYAQQGPIYPGRLLGVYQQLDVVLAKRLHAVLLPFSVEVPVVTISSTPSNRWMLDEIGAPENHMDLRQMEAQ